MSLSLTDIEQGAAALNPPEGIELPTMRELIKNSLDNYEHIHNTGQVPGLHTGFRRYDTLTGGMKPWQYIVLTAETNGGKSTFALNIINHALVAGKSVALFTMEMDRTEIMDLLWVLNAGMNRNKFNRCDFSESDWKNMRAAMPGLNSFKLTVVDDPIITMGKITKVCAYLKATVGLDLIVIDYLQLVIPELFLHENKEQQIGGISGQIRALPKLFKCPAIALSQLNEDGKVRDSRKIAHDASVSWRLEQEGTVLRITKGRSIPKGCLHFKFDGVNARFEEIGAEHHLQSQLNYYEQMDARNARDAQREFIPHPNARKAKDL